MKETFLDENSNTFSHEEEKARKAWNVILPCDFIIVNVLMQNSRADGM